MPSPKDSLSEPTYKDVITFIFNDIKRMAEQLDIEMMPTSWDVIYAAHIAMRDLLDRNTPPSIPKYPYAGRV